MSISNQKLIKGENDTEIFSKFRQMRTFRFLFREHNVQSIEFRAQKEKIVMRQRKKFTTADGFEPSPPKRPDF